MRPFVLSLLVFFVAIGSFAQPSPDLRFNGHSLGESAETFFSTATMSESNALTKDYCKTLLGDPDAIKKYEAAKIAISGNGDYESSKAAWKENDSILSSVGGCRQVVAALRGEFASIRGRCASSFGKGDVLSFMAGRLVGFNLFVDSSFADVIAEMEKRFGFPGVQVRPERPSAQFLRWEANGVVATVLKQTYLKNVEVSFQYADAMREFAEHLAADASAREAVPQALPKDAALPSPSQDSPGAPPIRKRIRVSPGVSHGLLISKVQPVYPASAKANHIQGDVVLHALIGKDGKIAELTTVSGPDELIQSAIDAVRQWQYRPYRLNGETVEVDTQITLNYRLPKDHLPSP